MYLKISKSEGTFLIKTNTPWGIWVAQSVKPPTLDFGSGHDLAVWFMSLSPCGACLGFSLPPSLSAPLPVSAQNKTNTP